VLLLEIAAQGVKGVSPAGGTARLRPGYNVIAADGASLRRLLEAMFHPAPGDGEALRGAPGPLRAGVSLADGAGVTFRLVRDFAAGSQLSRFDAARRAFEPVCGDPSALERVLGELGLAMPRGRLALLCISAAELPSRLARPGPASAPAAPRRALTHPEAEKRLAELRQELERSRRAEKLQYRLDGLHSRMFQADEAAKEAERLREARDAADAAVAGCAAVAAAAERLGDVDARIAAHEKALAKRDEALARLAADRSAIDATGPAEAPFWTAPRFWAGAGGGVAAAAAGIAGASVGHGLRYLALVDIPAFGWAAWVALRWVSAAERAGRAERRRRMAEEHERKVMEAWERESAELARAMRELGVAGIRELREALGRLADARAAAERARADLADFEVRPETKAARDARAALEAEAREVEAGLAAEAGGYVRDPRSVEMEIQRVEADAALPPAPAEPVTAASPPGAADPFGELLALAGRELGGGAISVGLAAQARASQLLQALSAGRLASLAVDERSNVLLAQGGRALPAQGFPAGDRDLAFLALKLALVERAVLQWRGYALADDAFQGLSEVSRRAAARVLKQLARPGQLVHATADPAFREAADHVA
jgi:hypothetical protein